MEKLISYSQHGEDDLVWKFFDRKSHGLIVEVGAFDGVHFSNSLALEKLGWQSILIEAHPTYFPKMATNRPKAMKFNCAAVGDEHTREISFLAEEIGLLSGVGIDVQDVNKRYEKRGIEFNEPKTIKVPARTLNSVLEEVGVRPGEIDCITIDVEGTELDVLKGLDIAHYRPKVLIVESNSPDTTLQLDDFFAGINEYFKSRTIKVNLVYVLGKKNAERMAQITIDCIPAEQQHPLGERYTVNAMIESTAPSKKKSFFQRFKERFRS